MWSKLKYFTTVFVIVTWLKEQKIFDVKLMIQGILVKILEK